jgi:hypothetical protein
MNFTELTQQAVAEVKANAKTKRKYNKVAGENCHMRWIREHTEKWNNELSELEDIIGEYDAMGHAELFEALQNGNMALHYAYKRKQKLEALIAKYNSPEWVNGKKVVVTEVVEA